MKRFHMHTCIALGMLVASATAAASDSMSLNRFKSHVLPVLVQVDSRGQITDVSSSTQLSPSFDRLLRSSLDQMINAPAMDHGRPVASQFVINLALDVKPQSDGKYEAKFAYVSASPVPLGSWYWSHEDGHRLALVNRNGFQNWRPRTYQAPNYQHYNNYQQNRSYSSPSQTATRSGGRSSGKAN